MAVDGFLKLDNIKGESKVSGHEGEIDVLDVHFALNQPPSTGYGGGAGTGKVDFHDISFTKRFDKSSPVLMGKCADGTHIKNGLAVLRKASGTDQDTHLDYLKIKMEDIIIAAVTPSGLGSGDGMEHLTLAFSKITMDYTEQKDDGGKGDNVTFGWDVKAGKKIG
jgi:type VI secretion system secreted protein Hcp